MCNDIKWDEAQCKSSSEKQKLTNRDQRIPTRRHLALSIHGQLSNSAVALFAVGFFRHGRHRGCDGQEDSEEDRWETHFWRPGLDPGFIRWVSERVSEMSERRVRPSLIYKYNKDGI